MIKRMILLLRKSLKMKLRYKKICFMFFGMIVAFCFVTHGFYDSPHEHLIRLSHSFLTAVILTSVKNWNIMRIKSELYNLTRETKSE